jgi:hypothetical protein
MTPLLKTEGTEICWTNYPVRKAYRDKKNTSSLLAATFIFGKILIF